MVYIVGPNGAGKTTLLETINGLLAPIRGRVLVLGRDVQRHGRSLRCQIGYVPQDFISRKDEPYTAKDVVLMGRFGMIGPLRKVTAYDRERVDEVMSLLGIEELSDKPIGKLSGGQQQKVMIARALAKEPKILLLDEPFSNLDFESQQKIPRLVEQIHLERGLTTLVVTHNTLQIIASCERIVMMSKGAVVFDGRRELGLRMLGQVEIAP